MHGGRRRSRAHRRLHAIAAAACHPGQHEGPRPLPTGQRAGGDSRRHAGLSGRSASAKRRGVVNDADYEALFRSAPAGYVVAASDGTIVVVNQLLCDWTGRTSDELVGTSFSRLLPAGNRIMFVTHAMPQLEDTGTLAELSADLLGPGRERIPVLLSATRTMLADGSVQDRIIVFRAAERRLYEQELAEALRGLQEAEIARQELLTRHGSRRSMIRSRGSRIVPCWSGSAVRHWHAPLSIPAPWGCCSSTSTGSSASMTASGIRQETKCCVTWPHVSRPRCARVTWWRVTAATSSSSWCRVSAARRICPRSRPGCGRSSSGRLRSAAGTSPWTSPPGGPSARPAPGPSSTWRSSPAR
ncbi:PAS domain-containing protein [Vibrio cholerae]|nr:PAS domain-containing protein [Vibrio cholerae]